MVISRIKTAMGKHIDENTSQNTSINQFPNFDDLVVICPNTQAPRWATGTLPTHQTQHAELKATWLDLQFKMMLHTTPKTKSVMISQTKKVLKLLRCIPVHGKFQLFS